MSTLIQSVLSRQLMVAERKSLSHPVKTGYGKANRLKRSLLDTEINPKELPSFPDLDYMPTESTALNNVVMTDNNFRIDTPMTDASERKALHFQTDVAALHGFRTPRPLMSDMPAFNMDVDTSVIKFNKDAMDKNIASAEYGMRKLDEGVLKRVKELGRGTRGDLNRMRAWGRERDSNKSVHDRNDLGLSYKTKSAKAMSQTVAPNHKRVKPVLAAAPNV